MNALEVEPGLPSEPEKNKSRVMNDRKRSKNSKLYNYRLKMLQRSVESATISTLHAESVPRFNRLSV